MNISALRVLMPSKECAAYRARFWNIVELNKRRYQYVSTLIFEVGMNLAHLTVSHQRKGQRHGFRGAQS